MSKLSPRSSHLSKVGVCHGNMKKVDIIKRNRIIRKRNYGIVLLSRKYAHDIYKAVFEKKKVADSGILMYASIKAGADPSMYYSFDQDKIKVLEKKMRKDFTEALTLGSKKVMDKNGKVLNLKIPTYKKQIDSLVKNNLRYVKKISEEQRSKIVDILQKGIKEGKSYNSMVNNITDQVKGISRNKADLIAKTEVNRAAANGMAETMKSNGITKYLWVSAGDNRVGNPDEALNGRVFEFGKTGKMSIKGTDGKNYIVNKSPMPVKDTHPRCRCLLVKA